MAKYRKVHTTFWTDPFVEELTQEQKLFYLYLITNTKTKQSGIYEISKKYISYETGFSIKEVTELLNYFQKNNKIHYSDENNEIMIVNWNKFNYNSSLTIITCVYNDLKEIKTIDFIKKIYDSEYIEKLLSDVENKSKKDNSVKEKYTPYIDYLCSIHDTSMEYISNIDTTSMEYVSNMDTPSIPNIDTPSMGHKQQEQEQEQEQEQKKEQEQKEEEALTKEQLQKQKESQKAFDALFFS